MSITEGKVKTSVGFANPDHPTIRIRPLYTAPGVVSDVQVEVVVLFDDGSTGGVVISLLPLLTLAQRNTLINTLTAVTTRVQGELR